MAHVLQSSIFKGSHVPSWHDAISLHLPMSQMKPLPQPAASPHTPPQPSSPHCLPTQSGMQHRASVHFSPILHAQSAAHDSHVSPGSQVLLPQKACFRHLPDWHFSPDGHAPHCNVSPQPSGAAPQSSACPSVFVASLAHRLVGMQSGAGGVMIMSSPGPDPAVPVEVPMGSVVDANS
jgi:hypothetical protein